MRRRRPRDVGSAHRVPEPERPHPVLRHAIVARVEPLEVDAVSVLGERPDRLLDDVPVRAVVQAGDVCDEKAHRLEHPDLEHPDERHRLGDHVALVLLALPLAGAAPRSARGIGHEEVNPISRTPSVLDHPREIPDVHADRGVPEVLGVRPAGVRVVVERHRDVDAGAAQALGHPTAARKELEDVHEVAFLAFVSSASRSRCTAAAFAWLISSGEWNAPHCGQW